MRNNNEKKATENVEVQIDQVVTVTIKRLGINGEGIGYYHRKLIFIPGALPNEKIKTKVTEINDNFLRGSLEEILKESNHRVTPKDDYANEVGGFELENLAYDQQLEFKRDVVKQALSKFQPRGFEHYKVKGTIGMDEPYEYRNKAQFQVRTNDEDHVEAGLYKEGTHDVVDLKTCSVQYPVTMKVMRKVVSMIEELKIPTFVESNHSGILKTIVVRAALNTDDVQLVFITNTPKFVKVNPLLKMIEERLPEVNSVMQNINPGDTPLIWGDKTIHLAGKEKITEEINGLSFDLSPRAFLQLNSMMTEKLYQLGADALNLSKYDKLIDAYAGVGTIGLSLANQVEEVRGMDTIADAVNDANLNAEKNNIQNASYEVGSAEEIMPKWTATGFNPTALIVDPPRSGLDQELILAILQSAPEKFVYISCNPSTLAKDLVQLSKKYKVDYLQPVDMMPQTPKVEVVVKFTKK